MSGRALHQRRRDHRGPRRILCQRHEDHGKPGRVQCQGWEDRGKSGRVLKEYEPDWETGNLKDLG